MIDLGLSSAAKKALLSTLAEHHIVGTEVHLLDLEHRSLGKFDKVLGGQVVIDAGATVTRQAQVSILDPRSQVKVDTDEGLPRVDRMIRVYYNVWVGSPVNDWVSIPVFTGPITIARREAGVVSIEALGKEHLAIGPTWKPATYPKGRNRVETIRSIMRELAGERHFQMVEGWSARLDKTISMTKNSSAWSWTGNIARSMSAQVFYDGRGRLRLRKKPIRSVFTFRDGDGGTVLTIPIVSEGEQVMVNIVRVVGAVPKGKKGPLTKELSLPSAHPYSPQRLGRNGKPRYLPEAIEDDSLRTQAEVDAAAKRRIAELQIDEQQVSFDSLPIPMLEEYDLVTIDCEAAKGSVRIVQMTIPLGHAGVSTVGYIGKLSRRR